MNGIEFFIILIFCHFIGDFALQSNTMAKGKNWKNDEKTKKKWEFHNKYKVYHPMWKYYLTAHGFIHGACIYIFTGFIWIAVIESLFHIIIDYFKCSEYTNIHGDQFLHLTTKLIYVLIFLIWGGF